MKKHFFSFFGAFAFVIATMFTGVPGAEATSCNFSLKATYCSNESVSVNYTNSGCSGQWPDSCNANISGPTSISKQYSGLTGTVNFGTLPEGTYQFWAFDDGDQCDPLDLGNTGNGHQSPTSTRSFTVENCGGGDVIEPRCNEDYNFDVNMLVHAGSPVATANISLPSSGEYRLVSYATRGESGGLSETFTLTANGRTGPNQPDDAQNIFSQRNQSNGIYNFNTGSNTITMRETGRESVRVTRLCLEKQADPVPTCSLTANPNPIDVGGSSTLSWTTTNATSATINNGIGGVSIPTGVRSVSPAQTTTYTMTVANLSGVTSTCSVPVTVIPGVPDFIVDKRVWDGNSWENNATLIHGEIAYYRIAVKNTGTAAGDITLTDILGGASAGGSVSPMQLEVVDCQGNGGTHTGSLSASGVNFSNIPADELCIVDYQRTVSNSGISAGSTSTIPNTAKLSNGKTDPASITISGDTQTPVFDIQKQVSTDGVNYSESVSRNNNEDAYYKVVITNTGNVAGTVTATDLLGSPTNNGSLTGITGEQTTCIAGATCTGSLAAGNLQIANLPAGTGISVTYKRTANSTGIPSGQNSIVPDTVTLSYNGTPIDTDDASVTIREGDVAPEFVVNKTVSNNGIDFGDVVTVMDDGTAYYKVTVTNVGNGSGNTVLTDILGTGTNGGSASAIVSVSEATTCATGATCTGALSGSGVNITNLAAGKVVTVTYQRTADNANVPAGQSTNVIDVAKLSTGDTNEAAITIPGPLVNPVCSNFKALPDPVNSNQPFSLLWNGLGQVSYKITTGGTTVVADNGNTTSYDVTSGITQDTTYTLTIYNGADQTGTSHVCETTVTVEDVPTPDFTLTKGVSKTPSNYSPAVTIADDANAYYEIVVKNTGNAEGYVTVSDIVGNPTNGGTLTLDSANVSPSSSCFGGGELVFSSGLVCLLGGNGTSTDTVTITYVKIGDNTGIPVDDSSDVNNTAKAKNNATGVEKTDDAKVTISGPEPEADLAVQITVDDDHVEPSEPGNPTTVTYNVPWQNKGNVDMANTTIEVTCNADAVENLQSANGTANGNVITFGPFDTTAGQTTGTPFTFTADLKQGYGATQSEEYDCDAHIESADFLPITTEETEDANNDATETVYVDPPVVEKTDITVTKEVSPTATKAGEDVTYTLTYTNNTTVVAENAVVTDDFNETLMTLDQASLPAGCTYKDLQDPAKINGGSMGIECAIGDLNANGTGTLTYTATVKDTAPDGVIPNTAYITTDTPETDIRNNSDSAQVTVTAIEADLYVGITADQTEVTPTTATSTSTVTYTVPWSNLGNVDMANTTIEVTCNADAVENLQTTGGTVNANVITYGPFDTTAGQTGTPFTFTADLKEGYGATQEQAYPCSSHIQSADFLPIATKETNAANNDAVVNVTVKPVEGELTLTKDVNAQNLVNGQKATYTVKVTNSNATAETFTLNDVLGNGNNGGELTYDVSSQSISFDPAGSGTAAGNFGSGDVKITNLDPGASVAVTYSRTASNAAIPFNQSSQFINTAEIVETGQKDQEIVYVVGPTSGGSSSGGGSSGGSRRTVNSINLLINKEVQDQDGKWHDADEIDVAALVENGDPVDVEYRIVVKNEGNTTGSNVSVEDVFTSSNLKRSTVKSVEGATWNTKDKEFTIDKIRSKKSATITYTATLEPISVAEQLTAENVATITDAEQAKSSGLLGSIARKATIKGVGNSDPAFVKTELADGNLTLQKTVNKKVTQSGEEVVFNIIVHNKGDIDYKDLVITDNFPFAFADFVSAKDLKNIDKQNEIITFGRDELKAGKIWIIKVKARVKNSVPGNTRIRNAVTIAASNADLSDLYAYAEVIVTPKPQPEILISSGGLTTSIALMILGLAALAMGGRRFARKS